MSKQPSQSSNNPRVLAQDASFKQNETPDVQEESEAIRIMLVGRTGSGKSSSGNTMLGEKAFQVSGGFHSKTEEYEMKRSSPHQGRTFEIMDTPGLFDTKRSEFFIAEILINAVVSLFPGPHAVIFVIQYGRFTEEEYNAFQRVVTYLREDVLKYTLVLFTHGDEVKESGMTIEECIEKGPDILKDILKSIDNRYVVFNNRAPQEYHQTQVDTLVSMISLMIEANCGLPFENEWSSKSNKNLGLQIAKRVHIAKLKEQEYRKRIHKLQEEKEKLEQKLKQRDAEIAALRDDKTAVDAGLKREQETMDEWRRRMEQADTDSKLAKQEKERMKDNISGLRKESDIMGAKVKECLKQADDRKKELKQLTKNLSRAQEDAAQKRKEFDCNQDSIAKLRSKTQSGQALRKNQKKLCKREEQQKMLEKDILRCDEEVMLIQSEIDKIHSIKKQKEEEYHKTQASINQLEEQIKQLQLEAKQKNDEVRCKVREITELGVNLVGAKKEQGKKSKYAKQLEKKIKKTEKIAESLKSETGKHVKEAAQATEEFKNPDHRLQEIDDVIQEARQDDRVWGEQAWGVKTEMSKGKKTDVGSKMLSWAIPNFFVVRVQKDSVCCGNEKCRAGIAEKRHIVTKRLHESETSLRERVDVDLIKGMEVLVQGFQSRQGYDFEVIMVSKARVDVVENSLQEKTCFPGLQSSEVTCSKCRQLVGWKFCPNSGARRPNYTVRGGMNSADTFYGLILGKCMPK